VIGNATLMGYDGEIGSASMSTSSDPAPALLAQVSVSRVVIQDKRVCFDLTNNSADAVTIQSLLVSWQTEDGKSKGLHRIKINGYEIYHSHDDDGNSMITVDGFEGTLEDLLTIGVGETIKFEFEFEKGTHLSDFDLSIDFGDGLVEII
jgi:hypothetical protein